jgi:hypothetical protein
VSALDPSDQVERLGLSDVLMSVCPGAVLLSSAVLWIPLLEEQLRRALGKALESTTASFLLVLLAYAIGLVIHGWAAKGYVLFVTLAGPGPASRSGFSKAWWVARFGAAWFLHGRPSVATSEMDVDARVEMADIVRARYGESVLGLLEPNNFLHVFRILAWSSVSEDEGVALSEADALFRRRGFAQGVALAAILVSLQAAILSLSIWKVGLYAPLRQTWLPVLVGLAVIGTAASFLLRDVARKLHSDERIFTYSILRTWQRRMTDKLRHPESANPAL